MTNAKCVACSSAAEPLSREECEEKIKSVAEWALDESATSISRRFSFKNFAEAIKFADRVGELAEEMGHHPVLTVGWGFCTVKFKTSKIKGLHNNDFVMAAEVNKLVVS